MIPSSEGRRRIGFGLVRGLVTGLSSEPIVVAALVSHAFLSPPSRPITDVGERAAKYEKMVEMAYQRGKGLNAARTFEFDDVIDPADTRSWVLRIFKSAPPPKHREGKKKHVDTW